MPEENKPRACNSVVLKQAKLAPAQARLIKVETPPIFIQTRKGKGGKSFRYVEGGYVIARLNEVFSPLGWDFEVLKEEVVNYDKPRGTNGNEIGEVWLRGRLLIKDPTGTISIGKTQYGTKPRYNDVPTGDSLKAAATDCLKKCASMLGIALDVYWTQLDENEKLAMGGKKAKVVEAQAAKPNSAEAANTAMTAIASQTDVQVLREWKNKIADSKLYAENQKKSLINVIDNKIARLEAR